MATIPEILPEALKKVACFTALDEESLLLIEERMRVVSYRAGETIFTEGEPGNYMFVVRNGLVRVLKRGEGDDPIQINQLRPGELGGLTSLFLDEARSATLQAMNDVELWVLDKTTFERLLETSSAFRHCLLTYMSENIRRDSIMLTHVSAFDGDKRFKVAVFDTKGFVREAFSAQNRHDYSLTYFDVRLTLETVPLAMGYKVVCAFVNDELNAAVIERLHEMGVELIAMRCAGYNNVDLAACERFGIGVVRVPAYSPHSVAEHGIALMLALNRNLMRAHARVRDGNFSLDGLVGFEMRGKTVGIVGTGRIGKVAAEVLMGFGCHVLGYDVHRDPELEARADFHYTDLDTIFRESDIISLYVPLLPETRHMIDSEAIGKMKPGVMLINTSRGGLLDTQALIEGLKSGHIGSAGLDVYEEESGYFFEDYSGLIIRDDVLARLMTFNNVIITSHQAFLTKEALDSIAATTFDNIHEHQTGKRGGALANSVC